ncbi:DNA repair and recombination protein RAD54 [Jimgerdemannia flammicorona]|uniref:DNA repair and recombination protein RAD54 n=1 Tax=Jimgerdemannia flammicorona TaxID=994334 RepID=A0A433DHD9_9FUNG|nr:DNA repair and recombination protein RAD54 [Jimgerdemannia flammicorona]
MNNQKRREEVDSAADYPQKKPKTTSRPPLAGLNPNTPPPLPASLPKDYNPVAVLTKRFSVPIIRKPGDENSPSQNGSLAFTTRTLGVRRRLSFVTRALHDHTVEGSLVLYDPEVDGLDDADEEENNEPKRPAGKTLSEILGTKKLVHPKVHVVVDPVLAKVLRPHQIEGVRFMYKCSTGRTVPGALGCIMADEMGLGKTLQCIALMWTLLRQSPEPNKPTIDKCIIACPSSLVRNWANELGIVGDGILFTVVRFFVNLARINMVYMSTRLVKWLGSIRISPMAVDNKGTKEKVASDLRSWASSYGRMIVNPVLIISYETLRTHVLLLQNCPVGLLLCDEGHRLKNSNSLTFQALNSLQVQRRIILSGTPIQNDLSEYFSLLNFANPGLLGTPNEFRKNYENPILRGRDSDASEKDREVSDQKLAELWGIVSKFIIRRTNDILTKYLPTKYEHVVFCKLSPLQHELYNLFLTSPEIRKLLKGQGSQPLKAITMLKKLCNHPDLLNLPDDLEGSEVLLPSGYSAKEKARAVNPDFSGKMMVLDRLVLRIIIACYRKMLAKIRRETKDKIVLISNYTQTLDLFERLCRQKKYGVLRLDGSMTIPKRQKLVDRFNDPSGDEFVFLLSSKAGGCGLNLIGANRLVLFDPGESSNSFVLSLEQGCLALLPGFNTNGHWNPAADQQALARVWRDGQKKDCESSPSLLGCYPPLIMWNLPFDIYVANGSISGFVYRFIGTGTIEEKIFQRQSHKQSLSSCVVDEAMNTERHFSLADLRQLFMFNETTACETHETFKCKRCIKGRQFQKADNMQYGDTSSWDHYDAELARLPDSVLREEAGKGIVSYVFQYVSHMK